MRLYRVKNKETGEFKSKSKYDRWSKKGRLFTSIGHVKNSVREWINGMPPEQLAKYSVVEYELDETGINEIPLSELNEVMAESRFKKDAQYREKRRRETERQIEYLKSQLKELEENDV